MRASLPRPARSSPRPPSIVPACVRSVSQQACAERLLCARPVLAAGATVGADAGSCGTQGGETQPSKPGARCCTPHTRMWTGSARLSGACAPGSARRPRPPTPTYLPSPGRGNSDPSLVPTSSRFSPPSDAECNPCIFSDWSKKEKKKKAPLQDVPSRAMGRSVTQGAQAGRPLVGPLPTLGSPSGGFLPPEPQDKHRARHVAHAASLSWMTDKSSRFTVLAKSQGTLLPAWTTANSYGGQGPPRPRPDSALVSEAHRPTSVFSELRPGHHGKARDHTGRNRDTWSPSDSK